MIISKIMKNFIQKSSLCALLATLSMFVFTACTDDDSENSGSVKNPIGFKIDLSQDWSSNQPANREAMRRMPGRNLELKTSDGSTAFLQETAISAIDETSRKPVMSRRDNEDTPATRGLLVTDVESMSADGFSSWCYYANGKLYFENIKSDKDGNLSVAKTWEDGASLRFYAIHPFDSKNFGGDADGLTYDFTVNTDVEKQEDLMYASTGTLPYNEEGLAPLHFQHALTAISFATGSNPDFDKTIKSISINGVHTKGTYKLPTQATTAEYSADVQGTWTNIDEETVNIKLDGLTFPANMEHVNQSITGPEQTFLLLPCADLNGVSFELEFSDGTKMIHNFTGGEWKAGYTYTYKLSKKAEEWEYVLTTVGDYEDNTWENYGYGGYMYDVDYQSTTPWNNTPALVRSYKQKADGTREPVEWRIVEYEYSDDNGATWVSTGSTPPDWIEFYQTDGCAPQNNPTTFMASYIELFNDKYIGEADYEEGAARNALIQSATPRSDWDLSTHDVKGNSIAQTTANCYIISAPGTYKFPLVYGNAIKNGETNSVAYDPTATFTIRTGLDPFVNYKGTAITNPWIKTDGTPTSAELVWTDRLSLYEMLNGKITISGDYIHFDVTDKNKLKQGNAVIAVKDENGDVMWSWNLWFAPDNVLDPILVKNHRERNYAIRRDYYYSTEPVGYRAALKLGSTYNNPRCVRAKVEQVEGGAAGPLYSYWRIRQNPGGKEIKTSYNLYQWGRKDALPGFDYFYPENGFVKDKGEKVDYATSIKNPGTHFGNGEGTWMTTLYGNVWTANKDYNDLTWISPHVKTIYDPSPQGFLVPQPAAFRWMGFSLAGLNNNNYNSSYLVGGWQDPLNGVNPNYKADSWNNGYEFYTNNPNPGEGDTFFMHALGYRNEHGDYYIGCTSQGGTNLTETGDYWSAFHMNGNACNCLNFGKDANYAAGTGYPASQARAIRPVKESQ